jgi:hypothetical protein
LACAFWTFGCDSSDLQAFLYDDLLRRQWARRADKRDPSLDITAESQKIDKDMLELARQRLSQVLQEVGLHEGMGAASSLPSK